jgi:hypothetical protein
MDGTLTVSTNYEMPNIKEKKKDVMNRIKSKLENAKLNLIYTELEEEGIPFERNYSTVKDLVRDFKGKVNDLDYNKVVAITDKVNNSLESMVGELEKGSTNAFTRTMSSPMAKTIAKTLGISLAGRTALILAPTVTSKLIIAGGLAAFGLFRVIKNRKEIIKSNEINELNNILMDLETTKEDDKYLDTRFSKEAQETIRNYLKENNIKFEDTGYRSLRACIYELDNDKKRSLCELLNNKLGKAINIDERVEKAKKKLNVIASTAAGISSGATLGATAAATINSIDPAIVAGPLNGSLLAAWVNTKTEASWFTKLCGGLGAAGTAVLEHVPFIGSAVKQATALENLAALGTLGAVGGAIVSAGIGIASIIKRIFTNKKNKKETEEFVKLDAEKYLEEDKVEFVKINENMHKPTNELESCIVDVVVGSLKEDGVDFSSNPTSVAELKSYIEELPSKEKSKAANLLNTISYNMDNDPNFVKDLKKAGKMSVGFLTAGFAAMSVYDIIKGGAFLPELSQKLFPVNNIHTPVDIPPPLDEKLDPTTDAATIEKNQGIYNEFSDDSYKTELTGDYQTSYGANYMENNPGVEGVIYGSANVDAGITNNMANNVANHTGIGKLLDILGIGKQDPQMVYNIPQITEKLNEMTPQELYEFYRTFNSMENDGSELYQAMNEILSYKTLTEKATSVITDATRLQEFRDIVNKVTNVAAGATIPANVIAESIAQSQKNTTTNMYNIDEEDLEQEMGAMKH